MVRKSTTTGIGSLTVSPRVWGWSDDPLLPRRVERGFPTRVGMVLLCLSQAAGKVYRHDSRFPRCSLLGPADGHGASSMDCTAATSVRGDATAEASRDTSDSISTPLRVFAASSDLSCPDAADTDNNRKVEITLLRRSLYCSSGFVHRRPGYRRKSLSQEHSSAPCSMARAARWASVVRLPPVPTGAIRSVRTFKCRSVG